MRAIAISVTVHALLFAALAVAFRSANETTLTETVIVEQPQISSEALQAKPRALPATKSANAAAAETKNPGAATGKQTANTVSASSYLSRLRARIESQTRYPADLIRRRIEGQAWVELSVAGDGSLQSMRVSRSSGHEILDQIALESVKNAFPFEAPLESISLTIPISFKIH